MRYRRGAVSTELKKLATPANLDAPPLDMGVEDHVSSTPLTVRKTAVALGLLEELLTIDLLLARDVLAVVADQPRMGEGTSHALKLISEAVAIADPFPADIHQAVRDRLADLTPGPRR